MNDVSLDGHHTPDATLVVRTQRLATFATVVDSRVQTYDPRSTLARTGWTATLLERPQE